MGDTHPTFFTKKNPLHAKTPGFGRSRIWNRAKKQKEFPGMVLVMYYIMYVHNNTDLIDLYPMKKQQDFFLLHPAFTVLN